MNYKQTIQSMHGLVVSPAFSNEQAENINRANENARIPVMTHDRTILDEKAPLRSSGDEKNVVVERRVDVKLWVSARLAPACAMYCKQAKVKFAEVAFCTSKAG
jgi:hypothetical protein